MTLRLAAAPAWAAGAVSDGVIAGAGTILTFIPILAIFFAPLVPCTGRHAVMAA